MPNEVVVVVAVGSALDPEAVSAVAPGAVVVAADGGIEQAWRLGLDVSILVGDLDSASPEAVAKAEAEGTRIERYPAEKDATDLELALDTALELEPSRIVLRADDDGRLDHLVSALLLLGRSGYAGVEITARFGPARIDVIRGEGALEGEPGELLSLVALHGPAEGVRTEGLVYPLAGETLEPGSSRGVSNVFTSRTARVSVEHGVLLAIRPGPEKPEERGA